MDTEHVVNVLFLGAMGAALFGMLQVPRIRSNRWLMFILLIMFVAVVVVHALVRGNNDLMQPDVFWGIKIVLTCSAICLGIESGARWATNQWRGTKAADLGIGLGLWAGGPIATALVIRSVAAWEFVPLVREDAIGVLAGVFYIACGGVVGALIVLGVLRLNASRSST